MSEFCILSAANPDDRARWMQVWQASSDREPFAHPTYAELFADGGTALAAYYSDASGEVLFPVIARPLSALAWCPIDYAEHVDLVSPYGYGGPFVLSGEGGALADGFWPAFDAWARERGVVAVFSRLSLFEEQRLPWPEGVVENNVNVVVRFDLDEDAHWRRYKSKVRKNVNKARRSGVTCTVERDGAHLDDFLRIYEATMDRNDAGKGYYFDRSFYERIVAEMPESFLFVHTWWEGRIVSTELVMAGARHLYSYLGGTEVEAFDVRPNDLLKHEVCAEGMAKGLEAFVLGGGYKPRDGIFSYKLAFAKDGEVPFHVGQRLLMPEVAGELVEARRGSEADWEPAPGYFPPYRA